MSRRLLNLLTALSLLVCVSTGALWVRSHYVGDQLTAGRPTRQRILRSYDGTVEYVVSRFAPPAPTWSRVSVEAGAEADWYAWPDFRLRVPHGSIVLATAVAPAWRFVIPRVRRRMGLDPRGRHFRW